MESARGPGEVRTATLLHCELRAGVAADLTRVVQSNRIINIHHAFLPAFPGARPYHAARARREDHRRHRALRH